MFNNLKTNQAAMEEKSDRIGGGYQPLPSNIYQAEIAYAYGTTSKNGAMGLVVKFNILQDGKDPYSFTTTFWLSDKKGNTFYLDKDGNPHNLAGFNQANHLCALVAGKSVLEIPMETRVLQLYNFDAKKEVPTEVNAAVALFGQTVALAIKHIRENKREKSPSTGEYEPVNEERFTNDIDKIFGISDAGEAYTFDEAANEIPFEFAEKWLARWKDKTDDKFKEVKGASAKAGTTRKLGIG